MLCVKQGRAIPEAIRWKILELYQSRLSGRLIAERLGISHESVYRVIREAKGVSALRGRC